MNGREMYVWGVYGSYRATPTKFIYQTYFGQRMNDVHYICKTWGVLQRESKRNTTCASQHLADSGREGANAENPHGPSSEALPSPLGSARSGTPQTSVEYSSANGERARRPRKGLLGRVPSHARSHRKTFLLLLGPFIDEGVKPAGSPVMINRFTWFISLEENSLFSICLHNKSHWAAAKIFF